jgi:hydroxymethylglutaryl-CoA synthase
MTGIVSYGFYLPKFRIKTQEIASVWGKNADIVEGSLGVLEKTIAQSDEDSLTMGFEASLSAISKAEIDQSKIGSVFFGSETPPYAVNPSSTVIASLLGLGHNYNAYDTQFACKAATGAIVSGLGVVKSGQSDLVLCIGSDKANSKPGDALEFTAGSGAVAVVLGNKDVALEVVDHLSFSSDTPDFWRRSGSDYPSHAGRFTGEPSYFHHVYQASTALLQKTNLKPEDFAHAVFHMPNGKFPTRISAKLGFSRDQIQTSLVVKYLGNSYSASSLMGLMAVLEKIQPGELIFMCSYGSGAGSDAFVFRATENINKVRQEFKALADDKKYIDYLQYRQMVGNLR